MTSHPPVTLSGASRSEAQSKGRGEFAASRVAAVLRLRPCGAALRGTVAVLAVAMTAALGIAGTGAASAQIRPLPQSAVSRGLIVPISRMPVGNSRHNVFGTIVRIGQPIFVLRTRFSKLIRVDATTAMARGSYSAPLFVGKVVLVSGSYDPRGVLHATTVTRQPRIDRTTPLDD